MTKYEALKQIENGKFKGIDITVFDEKVIKGLKLMVSYSQIRTVLESIVLDKLGSVEMRERVKNNGIGLSVEQAILRICLDSIVESYVTNSKEVSNIQFIRFRNRFLKEFNESNDCAKNVYEIHDNVGKLYLMDRKANKIVKVLFDAEDYEKIYKYHWYVTYANGYRYVKCGRNPLDYMHRKIKTGGIYLYHVNGDNLDNRKKNLEFRTIEYREFLPRP
jgi:hypothetical protein